MGCDTILPDRKAVRIDGCDVAETDDRVAIRQNQLEIGQRTARYDHSDFCDRHRSDRSCQRTESPLTSNSTREDQRERGPADDGLARCQALPATSS